MRLSNFIVIAGTALAVLLLAGCGTFLHEQAAEQGPEKLYVHPDGSMEFQNRPIGEDDVVIYEDGFGGEKAAVRVRAEPLHPDFFRDTIVVERLAPEESDQTAATSN